MRRAAKRKRGEKCGGHPRCPRPGDCVPRHPLLCRSTLFAKGEMETGDTPCWVVTFRCTSGTRDEDCGNGPGTGMGAQHGSQLRTLDLARIHTFQRFLQLLPYLLTGFSNEQTFQGAGVADELRHTCEGLCTSARLLQGDDGTVFEGDDGLDTQHIAQQGPG